MDQATKDTNIASEYRKKPVVISAIQWDGTEGTRERIVAFFGDKHQDHETVTGTNTLIIGTLEGPLTASLGDFIIRGVKGEFYPCKPDIFEATYDQV